MGQSQTSPEKGRQTSEICRKTRKHRDLKWSKTTILGKFPWFDHFLDLKPRFLLFLGAFFINGPWFDHAREQAGNDRASRWDSHQSNNPNRSIAAGDFQQIFWPQLAWFKTQQRGSRHCPNTSCYLIRPIRINKGWKQQLYFEPPMSSPACSLWYLWSHFLLSTDLLSQHVEHRGTELLWLPGGSLP